MAHLGSKDSERRRSPRFNCGGQATVYCLPLDGTSISATLRNLSSGGICLDASQPIKLGARAELVVRVNTSSFRAAALAIGRSELSGTSLQFVRISAGGKETLADLLERLARLQALNRRLRSSRIDPDTERALAQRQASRFLITEKNGVSEVEPSLCLVEKGSVEPESEQWQQLIRIDLFG